MRCPRKSAGRVVLFLCGLSACADSRGPPASAPPHVVLVCIDTLRADHTSLYGYARPTTPNLERIAAEGLVLRNHFSNAPWTKPSVASILTGLHPSAHGSRVGQFGTPVHGTNELEVLSEKHDTLPERLRRRGYRTVAHVSNYNMLSRWGYGQGYDDYRVVEQATDAVVNGSDREAVETAVRALDGARAPTFVWVHLMSVHQYVAPAEYRRFVPERETPIDPDPRHGKDRAAGFSSLEGMVADYDNSVLYADALLGELYDAIRERHPRTLLVVTSDHGEEFYERQGFEHCWTLHNELLKVPCVFWGPGVPTGSIDGLTDSLDLLPTLLAHAGAPADASLPGRVLFRDGEPGGGKDEVFAEQHHRGPYVRYSLIRPEGKLVVGYRKHKVPLREAEHYSHASEPRLRYFSDALSPVEREEVTERVAPELLGSLRQRVEELKSRNHERFLETVGGKALGTLDERDLRILESLGYAGGD